MANANTAIVADTDLYTYSSAANTRPPEDWESATTSITSSVYRGIVENGRRYQTLKSEYFIPSDEKQFDAYEVGHTVALVMESHQANPLFRSPVGEQLKQVLDIGTGQGSWAIDVADMFPEATVRGVDLFPPPNSWLPPNCIFEVDNILNEWTWLQHFDLIHMRIMDGAFTHQETAQLYQQCYDNLQPGGWIELLELSPDLQSEDNAWPNGCPVREWFPAVMSAAVNAGRPLNLYHECTNLIRNAGFVEVQEETRKWPIGPWARDRQLKEAGAVNLDFWLAGVEGYAMYLLTRYGNPEPWSRQEVQVFMAQVRKDLMNPHYHLYHNAKRVWARKPCPNEVIDSVE